MLEYVPSSGLTRKRKRQIKKMEKQKRKPSKIYLAAYITFFICLLLYRYIGGFVGLVVIELLVIGIGLYLSKNEIKFRKKVENESGVKALDIMVDSDFKLTIMNKYYSDEEKFELCDMASDYYSDRDMSHFAVVIDKNADEEILLAFYRCPDYISIHQMDEILDMKNHFKVDKVMLYTNGYVGNRAMVFIDDSIQYKDRDALLYEIKINDIRDAEDLLEFSYAKSCPFCNSKLITKQTFGGKYYVCTSASCHYKIKTNSVQ